MQIDRARFDALAERSRKLDRIAVDFGSMGPKGGPSAPHPDADGLSVAEVFMFHELGLGVPERSVVRAVAHGKKREINAAAIEAARQYVAGLKPEDEAAKILGKRVVELLRDQLQRVAPPLAEETLLQDEVRESSDPLQGSGAIEESLRYRKVRE